MRHHNPGGATDGRIPIWIAIDEALCCLDRRMVILHFVHVIRGRTQDLRGVFVLRESVGKFE